MSSSLREGASLKEEEEEEEEEKESNSTTYRRTRVTKKSNKKMIRINQTFCLEFPNQLLERGNHNDRDILYHIVLTS